MKKIAFIYINTLFAVLFSGFPTMQAQEKALILRLSGASSLTNDLCLITVYTFRELNV